MTFIPSNEEKISEISQHLEKIMNILGLDTSNDNLKETPLRVAKMYVNEMFSGLDPNNEPKLTLFNNTYNYHEPVIETNITVHSVCEHHFLPIIGKAHVAYIPGNSIIGLSKINRIVDYYSHRAQVQERLTIQIAEKLKECLQVEDVAVIIEAEHLCVSFRGIKDDSTTITSIYGGEFKKFSMQARLFDRLTRNF